MTRPMGESSVATRMGRAQSAIRQLQRRPAVTSTAQFDIKIFADTTALATGDGKFVFAIPDDLDGTDLSAAAAYVTTNSSSGAVTVQIRNVSRSVDMLSTRVTIDSGEPTSYTAATPSVVDTTGSPANNSVSTGNLIAVDVDTAGTGAKGLGVILTFGSAS